LPQDIIKIPYISFQACRAERSTLILLIYYLQQNRIILLYSFSGSHKLIALLVCPYGLRCEEVTQNSEWRDRHASQVSPHI